MTTDPYAPLVPDQTLINDVKYAARDFATMADDLLRRLKIEYETVYNDYATTEQGIMLRDLCAWAYMGLTWYLDRTASDCYLATARTRRAVERLVEQISYKMSPAAPSSPPGGLTLTFPSGTASGFEMKDRWRFTGPDGLQFESYAKKTVATALGVGGTISVDVRQGETRILTYTADGSKNQTYRLASVPADRFLAENAIEVWVDGTLWEERDFLEFDSDEPNHYEMSYLADPPILRFGDGLAGGIPPAGAEVKIRFLITDGQSGNTKANTIQTSVDTLAIAGATVTFTVNNDSGATGGADPEQPERAKRWAPSYFAARGAAITQQDYAALANTFTDDTYGAVAKAYAYNPRSVYEDLAFSALVTDVSDILSDFNTAVTALESLVSTNATSLTTILASMTTANTLLDTYRATMAGWASAALTGATGAKTSIEIAEAKAEIAYDQSQAALTEANAMRDNINGAVSYSVLLAQVDTIINALTAAKTEALGAQGAASGAKASLVGTVVPNLKNLYDADGTSGYLYDGQEVETQLDAITTQIAGAGSTVSDIQSDLAAIDSAGDTAATDAGAKLGDMETRIGELFSDDCLSNYVQVPILALDSSGDYAAPSIGLRAALQTELDSIREVTQVVEVIDGSAILVPAEISVSVSIVESYVPAEVVSQIEATIIGLLKGREFNAPLYLSDLYDAVTEASAGVDHVTMSIDGPSGLVPDVLTADGNLVPQEHQVIVYGTLDIEVV